MLLTCTSSLLKQLSTITLRDGHLFYRVLDALCKAVGVENSEFCQLGDRLERGESVVH